MKSATLRDRISRLEQELEDERKSKESIKHRLRRMQIKKHAEMAKNDSQPRLTAPTDSLLHPVSEKRAASSSSSVAAAVLEEQRTYISALEQALGATVASEGLDK
jgi:hypothetical protein